MNFTSTRDDYIEDDLTWDVNEIPAALAPERPMPESERQAEIVRLVTAAKVDAAYATLWISQGIDIYEARKRLRDLMALP